MTWLSRAVKEPIHWLLAICVLGGLLWFRDYGLSWDEPLFYEYADALGYAYTPANWFSGHFDLNQAYGPSGDDHKNRGPAYLLLAREPVYLLETLGTNPASAWHLLNFVTFLVGVYFVFRLCALFASQWAALTAALLFASQPLLWGHAFINPKDMPFLVFFAGAVWTGIMMVDRLVEASSESRTAAIVSILVPAAFLGIATSNRVLGPLAGVLVFAYFLGQRPSRRAALWFVGYGLVAMLIMFAAWPYLWEAPSRFLETFTFMADNPTSLPVLFASQVFRANDLPRRYLPFFLVSTLTEPIWPLFLLGLFGGLWKLRVAGRKLLTPILILAWLAVPVVYVLVRRPPLYDGMRHFLFVIPPVFIFGAMALDLLFGRFRWLAVRVALAVLLFIPGVLGIIRLHPYEYAYFNAFVGGTGGVFRHYETDYWLTCYKEAVERFDAMVEGPTRLFVHREAEVARPFASANVTVLDERGAAQEIHSGDYVLVNTRTNEDRQTFHDAPEVLTVGRAGATFCVVKSIP